MWKLRRGSLELWAGHEGGTPELDTIIFFHLGTKGAATVPHDDWWKPQRCASLQCKEGTKSRPSLTQGQKNALDFQVRLTHHYAKMLCLILGGLGSTSSPSVIIIPQEGLAVSLWKILDKSVHYFWMSGELYDSWLFQLSP